MTLTAATPINSHDVYEQANARARRPGQTRTTVIVNLAGADIERRMYARLQAKQQMQGVLLDMLKDETAELTA